MEATHSSYGFYLNHSKPPSRLCTPFLKFLDEWDHLKKINGLVSKAVVSEMVVAHGSEVKNRSLEHCSSKCGPGCSISFP